MTIAYALLTTFGTLMKIAVLNLNLRNSDQDIIPYPRKIPILFIAKTMEWAGRKPYYKQIKLLSKFRFKKGSKMN